MRFLAVFLIAALSWATSLAQQFKRSLQIDVADSITSIHPEWVDLDNDGLLDVLLLSKSISGNYYLFFIKGDTANVPVVHPSYLNLHGFSRYDLYDYNGDNAIDIIVPEAGSAAVLQNTGDFSFQHTWVNLPSFDKIWFVDLDDDALPECVVSKIDGTDFRTDVFVKRSSNSWQMVTDSLQSVSVTDLISFDFNNDGVKDLAISGRASSDSVFTRVFFYADGRFDEKARVPVVGNFALRDKSVNDTLTLVLYGTDETGAPSNWQTSFKKDSVSWSQFSNDHISKILYADMNSDGIQDEILTEVDPTGNELQLVRFSIGTEAAFDTLKAVSLGDCEHDGDLDLVAISERGGLKIIIIENDAEENESPSGPKKGMLLPIYGRTLVYWERALDDLTDQHNLTYDLYLEGNSVIQTADFDLLNFKRLRTRPGNNGFANFKLLQLESSEVTRFGIQSVDNAFHSGPGGTCIGTAQDVGCMVFNEKKLSVCTNELVQLSSDGDALWFSLTKGFLTQGTGLSGIFSSADTIVSVQLNFGECVKVMGYVFEIKNDTVKRSTSPIFACSGKEIVLEGFHAMAEWHSESTGSLGQAIDLPYIVHRNDVVSSTIRNNSNCILSKVYQIHVSQPKVTAHPSDVVVLKGESLQLSARGAQSYSWSPTTGLSSANVAEPVSTPLTNIVYTVTGIDSVGCSATATVSIRVEHQGFIPSLFTPNSDGKNDELKVYGVEAATKFDFTIRNRDGLVIWSTRNLSEATMQGWDGNANGIRQPAGVYFWRVEGTLLSGKPLLLNGKREGSVLLVR